MLTFSYLIFLALKKVFPNSINFYCAWHISQNLKKRFSYLNRGNIKEKKVLYQKIVNLPYTNDIEDFEEDYEEILKSEFISEENVKYLNAKWKDRKHWGKCFMKTQFCSGMCTSSRIEGKHRVLKTYLNSSKGLVEVFQTFKDLEHQEIKVFKDEIIKLKEKENKQYERTEIVKYFKDFSQYAINKIKQELIESNNYKIVKVRQANTWQIKIFID